MVFGTVDGVTYTKMWMYPYRTNANEIQKLSTIITVLRCIHNIHGLRTVHSIIQHFIFCELSTIRVCIQGLHSVFMHSHPLSPSSPSIHSHPTLPPFTITLPFTTSPLISPLSLHLSVISAYTYPSFRRCTSTLLHVMCI